MGGAVPSYPRDLAIPAAPFDRLINREQKAYREKADPAVSIVPWDDGIRHETTPWFGFNP